MSLRWYVLGFDYDDVVGAWQDWRLARQCVAALQAAELVGIREGAGDGPHLTFWYVREEVGFALDRAGVPWRRFLVGEVGAPPPEATRSLKAQ